MTKNTIVVLLCLVFVTGCVTGGHPVQLFFSTPGDGVSDMLAISGDGVLGTVQIDDRVFALRPRPGGGTLVFEIDQTAFPNEAAPLIDPAPRHAETVAPPAPAGGTLSVLLVLPRGSFSSTCKSSSRVATMEQATNANLNEVWDGGWKRLNYTARTIVDRYVEPHGGEPDRCNYGFTIENKQTGKPESRTVMAYADYCASRKVKCPRHGEYSFPPPDYWASPSITEFPAPSKQPASPARRTTPNNSSLPQM